MELLDEVILTLRRMHQPVIAAINGAAIGGGLCLALACDVRVASQDAYFRAAGINNGLTASELGLSYLLPRAIGTSRASDIMLTGRDVDADEAERIGLVSRKVASESLLEECYAIGERIAGFSWPGIELTKRTIWSGLTPLAWKVICTKRAWASYMSGCSPTTSKKPPPRARRSGRRNSETSAETCQARTQHPRSK